MSEWKVRVNEKRNSILAETPEDWRVSSDGVGAFSAEGAFDKAIQALLSPSQIDITTNYNAEELLLRLARRAVSSEEVTTAFCKRAAIAGQFTNCLTEVNYAQAIQRAKELDQHIQKTGTPVGPLHGLPISVKDSFGVKGLQSTLGCVNLLDKNPLTENAPLVQILMDLGAIVHVKTNVPQGIITSDSHNNIFGRTLNPYNTEEWTAGGSSGGEGALIALRGSLLGVGTDLAGSIRIPAWCCGVYGFKPTINRIPYTGIGTSGVDLASIGLLASAGPMATTLADLEYFMKVVIDHQPWVGYDPLCIPMPWQDNKSPKRPRDHDEHLLTIGLIYQDDVCTLGEEVLEVLKDAGKKLEAAGHTIVPLVPGDYPSLDETSHNIALPLLDIDNSRASLKTLMAGKEPLVPSVKKNYDGIYAPASTFKDDEELFISSVKEGSTTLEGTIKCTQLQLATRRAWLKLLQSKKIDVIMCACASDFAPPVDTFTVLPYTNNWNTIDVS